MLTIGVDPGTAITGYGLVSELPDGQIRAVDYGVITTSQELAPEKRLEILFTRLTEILHLHRPDSGAVEKLFFQKNVSTALSVGQARGVSLLAIARAGIAVAEYTPKEVKQAVCGYGGAGKTQVQQMVKVLLNLQETPKPDDAADALAVAICHLNSQKFLSIASQ